MSGELQTIGDFYAFAAQKGRLTPFLGEEAVQRLLGFDFRSKADHDLAGSAGFRNIQYGGDVMDLIFREVNVFTMMPQRNMSRTGFRNDTYDPSDKVYGGADGGSLGTALASDINEYAESAGYLHTPWNVTLAAQVESTIDDSVPVERYNRERFRKIHAQGTAQRLLVNAELAAANATANTTDAKADANTTAAYRGLGIQPIDRFVAADAEEDTKGGTYSGWYDIWNGSADRDSGTTFDAQVVPVSGTHGTDAPITTAKIDEMLRLTEEAGAEPEFQVLLTGRDTYEDVKARLGSQWRINMEMVEAKVSLGPGITATGTKSGADITFKTRTYEGRPWLLQKSMPSDGASRLYALDMRDWSIEWLIPTLYLDGQSQYVLQNYLGNKAMYLSGFRNLCLFPQRQGKVTDCE